MVETIVFYLAMIFFILAILSCLGYLIFDFIIRPTKVKEDLSYRPFRSWERRARKETKWFEVMVISVTMMFLCFAFLVLYKGSSYLIQLLN